MRGGDAYSRPERGKRMETVKFYKELAKILEVPAKDLHEGYVFPEEAWDSLTVMATAASIDTLYDVVIPVKKLSKCENVRQLLSLVKEEKGVS